MCNNIFAWIARLQTDHTLFSLLVKELTEGRDAGLAEQVRGATKHGGTRGPNSGLRNTSNLHGPLKLRLREPTRHVGVALEARPRARYVPGVGQLRALGGQYRAGQGRKRRAGCRRSMVG